MAPLVKAGDRLRVQYKYQSGIALPPPVQIGVKYLTVNNGETMTPHASTAVGDLIIACVAMTSTYTPAAPGWTLLGQTPSWPASGSGPSWGFVYGKIATGSDTITYTSGGGTGYGVYWGMMTYRGAVMPTVMAVGQANDTEPFTGPSLLAPRSGTILGIAFQATGSFDTSHFFTQPAGKPVLMPVFNGTRITDGVVGETKAAGETAAAGTYSAGELSQWYVWVGLVSAE